MMKLTLMIEGSKSAIAAVIASLPDDGSVTATMPPLPGSPTGTSPTGAGSSPMPYAPTPGVPNPAATTDDEGDDNGPVNANAPSVDSSGLPWDERIHSGTKTTKGDGTWTGRRGGPKGAEYDAIVAELRSRTQQPVPMMPAMPAPQPAPIAAPAPMPGPAPVPMMPAMPAPQPAPNVPPVAAPTPMPVPAPVGMEQPAVAAAPAYSPPPMPEQVAQQPAPAPIQTAVAAASGTLDFAQFMQHLSRKMTERDAAGAPLIHADYLAGVTAEISQAFGQQLSAITDISTNPQMITYAMQCLQRDQRW